MSLTPQENATKINEKFHGIRNPNLFETGEYDMIITDKRIRELCSQSALISPYHENNLQSESYDVTIGSKLIFFNREIFCLDIAKQSEIDKIYNEIDFPEDGYVIAAKEYILLSLGETISLPDNISAHIRPKTNCNRLGLLVTPQHCNSSYHGKLRIGVFNATAYPIRIRKGFAIAQIVFEELNEVASENKLYRNKENAHYQDENGAFRGAKFDDQLLDEVLEKMLS